MIQLSASDRIALTVTPDSVQLAPGTQLPIVLSVTNTGPVVDQFGLAVEGLDPTWYTISSGVLNLFPGGSGTFQLDIHLPDGPDAVATMYLATLRVISREAPDAAAVVQLPIDIIAIGGIEASLTPQRVVIGRRGTAIYRVFLVNSGNADLLVDLGVRDSDEALDVELKPDRVLVAHGSKAEAAVAARPRQRPLVSIERSFVFSVDVTPARESTAPADQVAETLALVVGSLVYRPPLASLAALPLGVRRLLMALAAAALAAALLIWFLAAPGRRGALIERVPPAQPVVAALESALNLPDKVAAGAGAGGGGAVAAAPTIKKFVLATPGQDGRTDYALLWEVEGADTVSIQGQPQPDAASGALHLDKLENTEYVLEARRGDAVIDQSVGLVILRPPDIQRLTAAAPSIAAGESTTLQWQVLRGDRATLGDQTVDPAGGSLRVTPTSTTTYTLTVENELGRTQRSVEVQVAPAAPPKL